MFHVLKLLSIPSPIYSPVLWLVSLRELIVNSMSDVN